MPDPALAAPHEPAHEGGLRAGLVLGALGVVFGDIGTSPLYTLQECLSGPHGAAPSRENVLGVVSLVLWAITLVVTIKYLTFLMRADNQGEGGIMALLALVPEKLRGSSAGRIGLVAFLVLVGAALLYGDGVITPAISVLSAVEGLEVATTSLKPVVVPATILILLLLFWAQRRGTGGLGKLFGPIMVAWFLLLGGLGVWHILQRPSILTAASPVWGVRFFMNNGWSALRVLGGVVLAVTGGEALYADMGHFGRRPIRAGWLGLIYPSLLLCYLGQGAMLLGAPERAAQPFYGMVPAGPWIYPTVALAAAATVIASQALISGVFSLTHQAIRLGYFPRLTVRHTSGESEGQIYLPLINWGLAGACIALVLAFRQSSRLAAAYGLAVSGTMLITSIVYFRVVRSTWRWPLWKALPILILFLSFDIPFLLANTLKFFDGGYLPFLVGVLFVAVMAVWRRGRGLVNEYFTSLAQPDEKFRAELSSRLIGRVKGTAVFMSSAPNGVPISLQSLVARFHVLHERAILLKVSIERVPFVTPAERFSAERIGEGLHRVVLRYGFMEQPKVPRDLQPALASVGVAVAEGELLYVLGRETYVATSRNQMGAVAESMFALLSRNARNATDDFGIPPEQVVELGMHIDL